MTEDESVVSTGGETFSRREFFQGAQFRIRPSVLELERNVLIPGDRFQPFCNEEVFCDEYRLFTPGAKTPLKTRMIEAPLSQLAPLHLLLGRAQMLDTFAAESEENRLRLRHAGRTSNAVMEISAYDMTEFYRTAGFRRGDSLIVTVEDWNDCRFSLEYRPRELDPSAAEKNDWIGKYEKALLEVCEAERDYYEIPHQLMFGFWYANKQGNDLRKNPAVSFDEYRDDMREIVIRTEGVDWVLAPADDADAPGMDDHASDHAHGHSCECGCGHDHAHDHDHGRSREHAGGGDALDDAISLDDFSVSEGKLDSLDAILEDVNAPIGYIELYSMTLDAIANGRAFEAFLAEMFELIGDGFADDAQRTAFQNFLEENWEACAETYHPAADEHVAPRRARLLDLNESRIAYCRALLASGDEERLKRETPEIRDFHRAMIETLSVLNASDGVPDDDAMEQLEARIDDLEDMWSRIED